MRQDTNTCQSITPRLCILRRLKRGLWHILYRRWHVPRWRTSLGEDVINPEGQHGICMPSKPTPMTVTAKTSCQHEEKFCPRVHFIPASAVTATPLVWGLMRRLNGNMWHMLGTVGHSGMHGLFWPSFFFFLRHLTFFLSLTFRKVCVNKSQGCLRVVV